MAIFLGSGLAEQLLGTVVGTSYTQPDLYVGLSYALVTTTEVDYLDTEIDGTFRQELTLEVNVDGHLTNTTDLSWYDLPAETIYSIFVSDDSTANSASVLFAYDLETPYAIVDGTGITIAASTLVIKFPDAQLIG